MLCGCSKAPLPDDRCVAGIIDSRIGKQVQWRADCDAADQVEQTVCCLLSNDLTIDSAVQIALLNNPDIQALFEEIGIAQADLVQAGLLQNPVIAGLVRFPESKHAVINTEFSIAQNFLDFVLIPLRERIAEADLERVQYKVAHAILELAYEVQETFYSYQAEQAKLETMGPLVEIFETVSQLAQGQLEQGNINDLEYQSRLKDSLESKVEMAQSRNEAIRLREKLNRLLGLRSLDACWHASNELPALPEEEAPLACLEEIALFRRLDLDAARWEVERIARMLGVKEWWAYTDAILGASGEKDAEGTKVAGPLFAFELPIFNYGQADRARLNAMLRQSVERLNAMEVEALAQVRLARDRLAINKSIAASFQKEIVPLLEQIRAMSQRYYNGMALSVYKLLDAEKEHLRTKIRATDSLKDYWQSRVALDRALGG